MSSAMSVAVESPPTDLLTAEEFVRRYSGKRAELVKGRVLELPMPGLKHGKICFRVSAILDRYLSVRDIGHGISNDTTVVLRRNPDTGRGPDVCFVSYAKLPKDAEVTDGPLTVLPELVFEVKSPSDRRIALTAKAAEYIDAGVAVVVVLDPELEAATVFRADDFPQTRHNGDELTLPDVLPGFAVPVREFFR